MTDNTTTTEDDHDVTDGESDDALGQSGFGGVDVDEAENAHRGTQPGGWRSSPVRLATAVASSIVLVLGVLCGWVVYQAHQSQLAQQQRDLFLQVGRQGALNLTTIDWQQADADVKRILDSSTGAFHDDFQRRSAPFIEVVKQAQSTSVGNVTAAGVESVHGSEAQVLVAIAVDTSNAGAPAQEPRSWRMRITVQQQDDQAKVSDVEFVP